MVKKSLLFTVILDVLTYASKHMEITGVKIPIIYNLLLQGKQQQAINDMTQELNTLKREMRLCMLWGFVKGEVQRKLSVYFDTHQGVIHE